MSKEAKSTVGTVPPTKNQRNKDRNNRKGKLVEHGGVCSACGSEATSSRTGTQHAPCSGFFEGTFDSSHLNTLAKTNYLTADGKVIDTRRQPINGFWISKEELTSRLAEEDRRANLTLADQNHCVVDLEAEQDCLKVRFVNGLNQPIVYTVGFGWVTAAARASQAQLNETPANAPISDEAMDTFIEDALGIGAEAHEPISEERELVAA
jgi:hypothetical protein